MKKERQSTPRPSLSPNRRRQVAVEADVHPVTVARVLAGLPTRESPRERVLGALVRLGLAEYVPASAPAGKVAR